MSTGRFLRSALTVALTAGLVVAGTLSAHGAPATPKAQAAEVSGPILGGSSLLVDAPKSLPVSTGCRSDSVGSVSLTLVELTATTGTHGATFKAGGFSLTMPARSTQSRSVWVRVSHGRFTVCRPAGATLRIVELAHTGTPTKSRPGGVVDMTARSALASSSASSGTWTFANTQLPLGSAGVIIQVTASRSSAVRIGSGHNAVTVTSGGAIPASTVIVPAVKALHWQRTHGTGAVQAIQLGYVTAPTNATRGGARLHLTSSVAAISGKTWRLAGTRGIPAASAAQPATSVLAQVDGNSSAIADPLAQTRLSPLATHSGQPVGTAVRLTSAGSVQFNRSVHGTVVAWLSGDLLRAAHTIDLTVAGSAQPIAAPSKTQLTFPDAQPFAAGDVLLLTNTAYTPGGLIADVDSVSTGANTTVTFHKGGLLDAFQELDLTSQVPLVKPSTAAGSPKRVPGAHIKPHDVTPINGTVSETFDKSTGFTLGKNPSLSGTVGFSVHPSLSVSITIHTGAFSWPTGVSIHTAVDGTTKVYENLTASGGYQWKQTFPLGDVALGGFDLGPVFVVPELSSTITLNANMSVSASLERSITETAHVGMTVTADGSGVHTSPDGNNGFNKPVVDTGSAPTFTASAMASAAVNFTFDLAIDGLAGPDAAATAKVTLTVNPGGNPWWKVDAEADFSVGINLNALNIGLLTKILGLLHIPTNPSWQLWHLGPWTIASSQGALPPPPGGGGSNGTPSAGPGSGSGSVGWTGGSSVGPVPAGSVAETTGGSAKTWTDYTSGGGTQGPTIAPNQTVGISCKTPGLRVTNGNTWWYQVSSSPWNSNYYVSADPFYNNGQTSGSLHGTPFDDPNVPDCHASPGGTGTSLTGTPETTGGTSNTWTDPHSAGGTAGPGIAGQQTVLIACRLTGFAVADGNTWWYQVASSPWSDSFYVSADAFYNNGAVSGTLRGTPFYDPAVPVCGGGGGGGGGATTYTETVGGVTHTWTNYSNAGGTQGPSIAASQSVQITCRATGFTVSDGDNWWYQVASGPWSNTYWASADAFYNNGATNGSLHGTPFYDGAVPVCGGSPPPPPPPPPASTYTETVGTVTHTWTNYGNAGGTQGPSIPAYQSVQIACRVTGFRVADGDTWWYRVASSPWNSSFYASADAFYNNGATGGSLHGTPFVDPNVPTC